MSVRKKKYRLREVDVNRIPECIQKNMETSFFLSAVFFFLSLFFLFQPNIRVMAIVAFLIALAFVFRMVSMCTVAFKNRYLVIQGVVIEIQKPRFAAVRKLFSYPLCMYTVQNSEGTCTIFLSGNEKLCKGKAYLFFFRERNQGSAENGREDAFLNTGSFLGFQEIERKEEDHDD